jgi:hypothetical protein
MLAMVGDRGGARPQTPNDLHPLLEDFLIVLERDIEQQILAPVTAATGGEIES